MLTLPTNNHILPAEFFRPKGLTQQGNDAWQAVINVLRRHDCLHSGGQRKVFYSPQEWRDRKESYGLFSELVIVHDGGDYAPFFNMDYECYAWYDEMQAALQSIGLFHEPCTCWYTAVHKI